MRELEVKFLIILNHNTSINNTSLYNLFKI